MGVGVLVGGILYIKIVLVGDVIGVFFGVFFGVLIGVIVMGKVIVVGFGEVVGVEFGFIFINCFFVCVCFIRVMYINRIVIIVDNCMVIVIF